MWVGACLVHRNRAQGGFLTRLGLGALRGAGSTCGARGNLWGALRTQQRGAGDRVWVSLLGVRETYHLY